MKPDTPAPASIPLPRPARLALASLSLAMLLSSLGTSIANVSLPALAHAFGASIQQVQSVVLAYLLSTTVLVVGAGRLGDSAGRKRILLAGIAVFTLASALCAAAPSLPFLAAARAVQGAGAAAMMALTLAFVGDTVPSARSASAIGWLGSVSALGTALGPALGGLLIARAGWPAIFLAQLPLGLIAWVLAWRCLPAVPAPAATRAAGFDHRGTALLALALGAFSLAMTIGKGAFGWRNAALLAAAVIAAAAFVRAQKRAVSPLLPLAMLRRPRLAAGFVMSMLVTMVMMATLVAGPFYLAGSVGLDAARVGLAMACGPAVAALGGAAAGRITERFGAQRSIVAGLALMLAACLMLALPLPPAAGLAGYLGPLCGLTAGYALFQASNNSAMMATAAPGERGVAAGLVSLARNLGLICGAAALGALFAAASGQARATMPEGAALAQGLNATFMAGALAVGAAMAAAWVSHARSRPAPGPC